MFTVSYQKTESSSLPYRIRPLSQNLRREANSSSSSSLSNLFRETRTSSVTTWFTRAMKKRRKTRAKATSLWTHPCHRTSHTRHTRSRTATRDAARTSRRTDIQERCQTQFGRANLPPSASKTCPILVLTNQIRVQAWAIELILIITVFRLLIEIIETN